MKTIIFKVSFRLIYLGLIFIYLTIPAYSGTINIFEISRKSLAHIQKKLNASAGSILKQTTSMTEYKIKIDISDNYQLLKGYQEVLYTNNEPEALSEIYFRLFPNMNGGVMKVTGLEIENQSSSQEITLKSTVLKIKLSNALIPHVQIKIKMHFEVSYPNDLSGNYGQFAFFKNILVSANFFPIIPIYDDQGWNLDLAPANADYVVTDAALFIVQITTPIKFIVAASGDLFDIHKSNDSKTTTHIIGPARDFYFAGSEYFFPVIKKSQGIAIESYASKKNQESAEFAAIIASDILGFMMQKLGPYPYSSFKIISAPTLAMGIEYPGVVVIAQRFFDLNRQSKKKADFAIMETTLIHEVIHQWFYNMVGSDQVAEPWLDESVTQYYTWRYHIDNKLQSSANALLKYYHKRMNSVANSKLPIGLATYQYTPNNYAPIVYSKGPLFFIDLEKIMTRAVFDRFMKKYFNTFKWKISKGKNLQNVAEETCKCSLNSIFNEWVYPQ